MLINKQNWHVIHRKSSKDIDFYHLKEISAKTASEKVVYKTAKKLWKKPTSQYEFKKFWIDSYSTREKTETKELIKTAIITWNTIKCLIF